MTNYKDIYYDQELKKIEDSYKLGIIGFGTFTTRVFQLGMRYSGETESNKLEYNLVKAVDMVATQIDSANSIDEKFAHIGTILLLLAEGIQDLKK